MSEKNLSASMACAGGDSLDADLSLADSTIAPRAVDQHPNIFNLDFNHDQQRRYSCCDTKVTQTESCVSGMAGTAAKKPRRTKPT